MRFNAKKCYILSIKSSSSFRYELSGVILEQVENNPYLGVILSNDLKWGPHISKMTKRANSTLGFLRRNLSHCPQDCKRNAYLALVRSSLEYGAAIWDPYLKTDIDKIERTQHIAARFITSDFKSREPGCVTKMLKDLELPPLQDRRKHIRLVLMYKVVEGLLPAIPPSEYLTPRRPGRAVKPTKFRGCESKNPVERQVTNNTKSFVVSRGKSDQSTNSFFTRTVLDWNHLDDNTVCVDTVDQFRSAVKLQ